MRTDTGPEPVLLGDIPAAALAARFGTPLYVYDAASIRQRFDRLVAGIGYAPLGVYYSCKANAAVGIIRLLAGLGARVDACSPGDLLAARRAGCADQVSYVGVGVSPADLDAVVRSEAFFIADSMTQLDGYADRIADGLRDLGRPDIGRPDLDRPDIGLRINAEVQVAVKDIVMAGAWDTKFGLHPRMLPDTVRQATARGLRVVCLHAHIGSDVVRPEPHLQTLRLLLDLSTDLPHVRSVCVGGGMAVASGDAPDYPVAEFGAGARAMLDEFAHRTGRRLELRVEPGGYLVMDSGVLLTTVTDVKPPLPFGDRSTPTFVCVDSSYNHVVSAVFHGTHHPIELARDRNAVPDPANVVTVAGNLMQAGDVLARNRAMPSVGIGDVLVVRRCGGYTSSRSSTFNERPRPAEVLVDAGEAVVLRRAETIDELFTRDV